MGCINIRVGMGGRGVLLVCIVRVSMLNIVLGMVWDMVVHLAMGIISVRL